MKNAIRILVSIIVLILINSCKKEETKTTPPILTTANITSITKTTCNSGGTITNDGGSTIISRRVCWSTNNTPTMSDNKTTDGAGAGSYLSSISGLTAGTTYFVRAYATNASETGYGMAMSFTTLPTTISILTTSDITNITQNTASCGGVITSDGGGLITARGVCWSKSQNPTISDSFTSDGPGIGSFSSIMTDLTQNTTYYVRAYATNSAGTGYGSSISFSTQINGTVFNPNLTYGTITDIEGNMYKTITIGNQKWMAENLRTSKYRNGELISTTSPATLNLTGETSPKYQWSFDIAYGRLYTWYAITDTRNVCPSGWHVPSDAEWTTLTDYLTNNNYGYEGSGNDIAKSMASTSGWTTSSTVGAVGYNASTNNSSGLTTLPSGYRSYSGTFAAIGASGNGYWWAATEFNSTMAIYRALSYYGSTVTSSNADKRNGHSVRCVMD